MTPADVILENGTIRVLDGAATVTDAIAVCAGTIVAVGRDATAARRGPHTQTIDLAGRTALPGFQDAHIHPTQGGLGRLRCDLGDVHGFDAYRDIIAAYCRDHPTAEWILGAGWYGDVFPGGFPHRSVLDAIEPHRPVVLDSHDGHGVWVNSVALQRAHIDCTTSDPAAGRIRHDPDGSPSGMLMDAAADLVTDLIPAVTQDDIDAALCAAQTYVHGLGITAWQDAAVGDAIGIPDAFESYRRLARDGRLTARVTGALWWDRDADPDEQLARLVERRRVAQQDGGRFRATAVKIMQDGVCENLTGAMLSPYRGQGEERGLSFIEPTALCHAVSLLTANRFDVHIHAVGDRAVREAIDAFGAAGDVGDVRDVRQQIAHIDIIDGDDVARMGRQRIIANVQPLWARRDPVLVDTKLPYLTDEQQARHFAFRALRDAGAPLALGSDWPVSSPDPLWGIHVAVNRTAPRTDPHAQDLAAQHEPLLPGQSLTVDDAVRGYTIGAAYANRLDADTGTLEVGKAADVVILDADPYTVPADALSDIHVAMTLVDGRVVHEA